MITVVNTIPPERMPALARSRSADSILSKFARRAVWVLPLMLALRGPNLPAADAGFYRVSTPTNQVRLNFAANGTLSWNGAPGGFSVEKSTDLSLGTWAPWARGTSFTSTASIKVHDFASPAGMVFIPAGYFTMGDIFGDTQTVALPVHPVFVSAFYMDKFDVTQERMRQVLQWAYNAGKLTVTSTNVMNAEGTGQVLLQLYPNAWDAILNFANGQFSIRADSPFRTNHPCVWVPWYGAVAFCNYLSQMEGLPVCYDLTNWTCDFTATGYRLPTEAEWEKAARGGPEGYRFPWTNTNNTITHAQADYKSTTNFAYDVNPTQGFNPAGGTIPPFTTPVGYFAPNGYGLYDMSGNVWQWVWDYGVVRYQTGDSVQFDPTGFSSGNRVFRGGSWLTVASATTVASRYIGYPPTFAYDDVGFRIARKAP